MLHVKFFLFFLSCYVRTLEDVKKVIEHAKLSENDLQQNIQPIYFDKKFENYKLLELNEHVLSDLKCGQMFVYLNLIFIYHF